MKKLLCVVLSIVMVLGMVMPMGVMAEETTELTQAERFEIIKNPYSTFDMNLFQDLFATDEDIASEKWYAATTAENPNILAYKGFAYTSYSNNFPNNYTTSSNCNSGVVNAFRTSKLESTEGMKPEADGSWTYTIGNVPFELGTIAETGKMGANAFIIRSRYNNDPTFYPIDASEPINAIPSNYLNNSNKAPAFNATISKSDTITQGVYTIDQSGLKSAELLMAGTLNDIATYFTVKVSYEGETKPVTYYAVSGWARKDLKDQINLISKQAYEDIDTGADEILVPKTLYKNNLEGFKALVGDDTLTALPSYWKGEENIKGDSAKEKYDYSTYYNDYLAESKWQQLETAIKDTNIKLSSKTTVDLSKITANCEEFNVLLPSETKPFVQTRIAYSTTKYPNQNYDNTGSYAYKVSVPLDPNKKVAKITLHGELRSPNDFAIESGGASMIKVDGAVDYAKLMLNYDGQETVAFDGEEYYLSCNVSRECGTNIVLGMTLVENETIYDEYVELNEELKAVDSATITNPECLSYRNKVAQLIAKSENVLLESDFDLSKVAEAEEKFAADEIEANAAKIIKEGKKTNFPISEATGANSRLFIERGKESATLEKGYINGVDFYGRLADSHNATEEVSKYISYSNYDGTGKQTGLIFKEDEGGKYVEFTYYGEDTKKFYVNPEEKVIKINKVDAAEEYYGENAAAAATINAVTLDIPDGKYESVSYLAGSTYKRTPEITFIYEDGSVAATGVEAVLEWSNTGYRGEKNSDSYNHYLASWDETIMASRSVMYFYSISELKKVSTLIGYKEYKITPDPNRVLTAIKFSENQVNNPISIISVWGNNKTIEEKLAELEAVEVIDKASAAAAKEALADFDAYLAELGYTLKELGSFKASYTNLANAVADFEANAEKNEAIKNKYTQLEMVGPWDVFTVGDDISNAKWKVTSTASEPNLLAYKGFADSSSGNVQPSKGNIYAFRADMIEGSGISQHEDGRYYVNVGSVPFRLGEIKTVAGERGANAWVPRGKLDVSAFTEGGIPDIATTGDVTYTYGGSGYTTNIMTGTFNINKTNISAINFLTTGVGYHKDSSIPNNRLYDVYVKYEGEEEQHGFMFAGKLSLGIDESVYAIPYSEYEDIMKDNSLAASTKEFEAYSVDEINALRGYTPEGIDFDTSKPITDKNYTLAQLNAALGTSYTKFPTNWTKNSDTDTIIKDVHTSIVATTKHSAISGKAKTLKDLKADLDTTKLASAYEGATVAIPTEATNFVKYRRGGWNAEYDTIVNNTKYPLDPNKKVESVRIEGNMTDISGDRGVALGSGGVYYLEEWDTGRGIMMLTYNGERKVNINGTEYALFMKVQRECGDGMFLGATYERKSTIFEEVESINARIDAIDENTKVAEIIAIRNNVESLKAESSYITDADFGMDKLTSAEATLSARKIAEATAAMSAITLESTIQDANAAKDLYDYALLDANVTEENFDAALVALFNQIHAQIADKTNLKGSINVKYFQGETPSAEVTIENATKFAGKPYKVILAYYDAEENLIGTYIENKTSVKDEKVTFTVKADKDFANATSVKGFIWKDFATLLPLSDANATEKKTAFKVLSIGNSFSNNAHTYLGEIAQNAGFEKVIVSNLFIGGCTLEKHYTNLSGNLPAYTFYRKELVDGKIKSTSKAETTMLEGILAEEWDVITIQQGSSHSAKPDKCTYLQDIIDYVNANKRNKDAKIVWHMTWSYKEGSSNIQSVYPGMTQMDMYNGIVSVVKNDVEVLEGIDYVIPAGTAVQNARVPMGDVFQPEGDGIHLNNVGCYLIGLVWFEKITGISLDTITYVPDNVTIKDNLATLKKAAKDALANPYEVTK